MNLHKEYHTLEESQVISFSMSFNRETTNWATSEPITIGYRVSVIPVTITQRHGFAMEESGAFTGFGDTLLVADRQSARRMCAAKVILSERKEKYLDYFRVRRGLINADAYKEKYSAGQLA
jgi:hypothetical protein